LMKKTALWAGFLILLLVLLLCTPAGAEQPTSWNIDPWGDNLHDLSLGQHYTFNNRRISLSQISLNVSIPNSSSKTVHVPMDNAYYEIADDVILIRETDGNRFNGRLAIGTGITLGSGIVVNAGSNTLAKGSKVLILEKNGGLHALSAGEGTTSSKLVTGEKLNIMHCFKDVQLQNSSNSKDGWEIPISFAGISFLDGSGYVSAGENAKLKIKIDYSSGWDGAVYKSKLKEFSVGIEFPNLTIHIERYMTWFSVELPLAKIEMPLEYGFSIDLAPTLSLEGAGKGDTVLSLSAKEGFGITIDYGVYPTDGHWIHKDPEIKLVSADMEGEIYYGLSWGPGITWMDIGGAACVYKFGVVMKGDRTNNDFDPNNPDDKDWHVCGKDKCLEGSVFSRYGPLSIVLTILGHGAVTIKKITEETDEDPVAEYYISKTFGDKSMSSSCPHWAYRLNVQVEDQDGNPVPNVNVSYKNVPEHYEKYASATTDKHGQAVLCTATGEIEVIAMVADPDNPFRPIMARRTIKKKDKAETITLQLDLPTKHVYFKSSESGEITNWPADIDFRPICSQNVRLPHTLPKKPGRQFLGWNTAQDGSGISYAPGTKLTLLDDLTLWAQWTIPGNNWFIVYFASGGTKAPMPQVIPRGQDAVLSTEQPESEYMIFRGWSPSLRKREPLYQPGDTLKFDNQRILIILYAVWDISPISLPIHISFDSSGLKAASLPEDVWLDEHSWILLEPAEPPIDSIWSFVGWSKDPNATTPEYKAGRYYYFSRNTVLYAVWKAHYKVIQGAGSVWVQGSGATQRFVANGNIAYFTELQIDGERFMDGVEISSGSTVADIRYWAMEKLSIGEHTVTFVYKDGEASAKFTVKQKIPQTGDAGHPILWVSLVLLGFAGLIPAIPLCKAGKGFSTPRGRKT